MATFDSPITTYSDTTPQKRVITDVISLIDPSDAPMVEALGGLDGASGMFSFVNAPGKVVEWLEDTLLPIYVADGINGTVTSTATTITVNDASPYQEGHILLISTEQVWVSAVDTTTEIITVTRNFGGTQVTIADAAAITVIGMARLEGDDSDDIAFTDRTTNSNFTQILHKEVKVTRTHGQISQYGIPDEMAYQENKAIPELMRLLERHFYYNAAAGAGSATTPRVMGGWPAFITGNLTSGASLAQSQFETAVMAAYADGGSGPWDAFCAPANLQKVKNFYDSSDFLRVNTEQRSVGMVVDTVRTPFGDVNLRLDRWALTTAIPLVDPKHAGFLTLYPFTSEPLAKSGDYEKKEIVGEFTLCMRQDNAHAALTAVS
jgi:hypothetical protein